MRGVWRYLRATSRRHLRASIALALLIGLLGGAVIAAVAGARRTDSALARFQTTYRASDMAIGDTAISALTGGVDLDAVARLPEVLETARMTATPLVAGKTDAGVRVQGFDATIAWTADDRLGTAVDTWKLLHGRRADPDRVDEITAGHLAAAGLGLHVGSTLQVRFFKHESLGKLLLTLGGELTARASGGTTPVTDVDSLADGPSLTLRVVGIHASPVELPPLPANLQPLIHLTPAFQRQFGQEVAHSDVMWVRLRGGSRDLDSFKRSVEALKTVGPVAFLATRLDQSAKTQTSIHLQANSLRLFAAAIAIAGLLLALQLLSRLISNQATDYPTLRAMGMGTRHLWLLAMARVAIITGVSAIVAAALAVALSPLTPIGLARVIEPSPGISVDRGAVIGGAVLILAAVLLAAAFPAWRAARRAAATGGSAEATRRSSNLAGALGRSGAPLTAVTGVRLALERGRGATAVSARASIGAVAVAAAALTAATTFGANLDHLLSTPAQYGATWDLQLGQPTFPDVTAQLLPGLAANPDVTDAAAGTLVQLQVGGLRVDAAAREQVKGALPYTVLAGRPATAPDEVVLGSKTLRSLGKHLGDVVDVRVGAASAQMRIVGRAVFADIGDASQLGNGVQMTHEALRTLAPGALRNIVWVRLADGRDATADITRLQQRLYPLPARQPRKPSDLVNFGEVTNLPATLAAVFAVAGLGALAHVLVTSGRRRRRDLAVLRALGFVPGQVRVAMVWQATTIVLAALVVGLPLGVAAGRWSWVVVAKGLGVAPELVVPWARVALVAPLVLVAALVVAVGSTRAVARGTTADALRTE